MRSKLYVIAFAASLLFISQAQAQTTAPMVPKGELSNAKNHTGDIWLTNWFKETVPSIPVLLKQFMAPVQSWIGTFIQVVRFC